MIFLILDFFLILGNEFLMLESNIGKWFSNIRKSLLKKIDILK